MTNHSLFNFQSIESDLQSAMRWSLSGFKSYGVGFQDFSGDYLKKDIEQENKRIDILKKIKGIKNSKKSKSLKKIELKRLEDDLLKLTRGKFHKQTSYQKRLNKASTYIRFNQENGYNATIDVIGDAWLQNAIHRAIKDFKFEYEHKNIQGWGGFRF